MNTALQGRVALVTGASSGIGRATALCLAKAGATVIVHAGQNLRALEETAALIRQLGAEAYPLLADFTKAEDRRRFSEVAWNLHGHIDICTLCAGANILTGPSRQLTFDRKLELLWQVDVLGTLELARAIGSRMKERRQGVILTFGWDGALRGMEGGTAQAFAAAKGAVMAFSLALAQELAPYVRVNCIAPGWIRTQWGQVAPEPWQSRACAESLLGRWGSADDVAQICLFLASPAGEFINGQIIVVNGGFNYRYVAQSKWPQSELMDREAT